MCRWLDPFLVARSEFLEWTSENRLRRARLAGLRSDKGARDVVREGWRGGGSRELGTT
jgi:ATP-dependent DNA ligase